MSKPLRFHRAAFLVLGFAGAAGCSGGSGGGLGAAIQGLSVADELSVITVDPAATTPIDEGSVVAGSAAGEASFPAGADYNLDHASSHVYDSSLETLTIANQILCMLAQTRYADLVNAGAYLAQIDEHKCEQGGDESSSETGQSSSAQAAEPKIWTVLSTRASNVAQQIVDFWITEGGGGGGGDPAGTIRARMVITGGASDHNPFGVFRLNFAAVPDGGTLEDAFFRGTLQTLDILGGNVGFHFYEEKGDLGAPHDPGMHSEKVQASIELVSDQTTGVAWVQRQSRENFGQGDTGVQVEDFKIAFDPTHVLRSKDNAAGVCLSRTEFETRVWRYNLYDALTGARVELNSGFGFETEDGDYGWMGYYGMWLPPDATLASGDTVTKQVYGNTAVETFTVVKAPGKLIKNTRHTLDLVELDGETFTWWSFGQLEGPPAQYQVEYSKGLFNKVAVWDEEKHTWQDLPAPEPINTAALGFLGMWSQSLGGSVHYVHGNDYVTYYAQTFVTGANELFTGGATEVDLYGWIDCLDSAITGAEAEAGQVFLPPSNEVEIPYHYVFEKDSLTLYLDADGSGDHLARVGLANGEAPQTGPFTWGLRSGPMVTSIAGINNPYEAWQQEVFYVYETGHNQWNQYAALLDALGAPVAFDPPLQFTYTHTTEADLNDDETFDGRKYFLGYNGPGNLFGIPSDEVDTDGDGSTDRWYPGFSIADGTLMGPGGDEYVVKAIDKELTLAIEGGACGALTLDDAGELSLPDGSSFIPPTIGPAPVVTDPPRVIEGVIQGG